MTEDTKQLKERLFAKRDHACKRTNAKTVSDADYFCDEYMDFLDRCKTEREAVTYALELAIENGFRPYERGIAYPAGTKVYLNNRGKALILAVIGRLDIKEGVHITAAHIDSPRLDLKQNPVYETNELAYFKTHYYGGIKKYQWPVTPLALHGVIIKKDGEKVNVVIGESEKDPKFVITDILPHLASEQMKKTMADGIGAEDLNILIGSRPFNGSDESELVKLNILNILFEKYGITEEDFISAELEAVPAAKACEIGFDRSMIGAYGHDDRVCAYPALMAMLDTETPEHTTVCCLTDKEETGSDGVTGLCSSYLKYFICDLADAFGAEGRAVLSASKCLSADVNAAYDPNFPGCFEPLNSSYLNRGVVVTKYTGARGKGGTSDASAEFVFEIRDLLDTNDVVWQTGELGKTDVGGGGTVAKYVANLNIDTIDIGVPVLSMHAPFEVVSKLDVYMTYRACCVFNAD